MIYNKACCLLANGEFERAEDLLKEAEKTCLDFLDRERGPEEEIDQEEVDQETGIIRSGHQLNFIAVFFFVKFHCFAWRTN